MSHISRPKEPGRHCGTVVQTIAPAASALASLGSRLRLRDGQVRVSGGTTGKWRILLNRWVLPKVAKCAVSVGLGLGDLSLGGWMKNLDPRSLDNYALVVQGVASPMWQKWEKTDLQQVVLAA